MIKVVIILVVLLLKIKRFIGNVSWFSSKRINELPTNSERFNELRW